MKRTYTSRRLQSLFVKKLKILFLLTLVPALLFAQPTTDSLNDFINKLVIAYKIPGLAIGIVQNNKLLLKNGYGITSTEDSAPVTTQTIFPILSCTKAFTATALGILVDRGKLKWNDKVTSYLPQFKLSDPKVTAQLTVADILSHRSGLETFEGDLLWYATNYPRAEVVRRIQYSPLRKQFRTDFGYQNVMYLVAGLIIEKVTGETWDNFLEKEIFTPLSMNNTSTSIRSMQREGNYAHPHLKDKPIPVVNLDNIGPAGSVNSTLDDMLAWLQVWLNEGRYKHRVLLSQSSFQAITSEQIKTSPDSDESYGFGWYIGIDKGRKVLSHGGGLPGYKSLVIAIPESKTGIIILTNKISYLNEYLAGVIMDYLASQPVNWKEKAKQGYGKNFHFSWEDERNSGYTKTIPGLAEYKGIYEDRAYGKAVIKEVMGKAMLSLLPGKNHFSGPMLYLRKDTLKIQFKDEFVPEGEVQFYRGADQKVKGFTLNVESSDFHFKYLDFKKK